MVYGGALLMIEAVQPSQQIGLRCVLAAVLGDRAQCEDGGMADLFGEFLLRQAQEGLSLLCCVTLPFGWLHWSLSSAHGISE